MLVSFTRPQIILTGLMYGGFQVELSGGFQFETNSGEKAVLNFFGGGWISKDTRHCEGHILDSRGKKAYLLEGVWDQYLNMIDPASLETTCIWKAELESSFP
jgi:hypothetical protein